MRGIADNIACCTVALALEPTSLRQYPKVGAANSVIDALSSCGESYSFILDATA